MVAEHKSGCHYQVCRFSCSAKSKSTELWQIESWNSFCYPDESLWTELGGDMAWTKKTMTKTQTFLSSRKRSWFPPHVDMTDIEQHIKIALPPYLQGVIKNIFVQGDDKIWHEIFVKYTEKVHWGGTPPLILFTKNNAFHSRILFFEPGRLSRNIAGKR